MCEKENQLIKTLSALYPSISASQQQESVVQLPEKTVAKQEDPKLPKVVEVATDSGDVASSSSSSSTQSSSDGIIDSSSVTKKKSSTPKRTKKNKSTVEEVSNN
jgi:hypothetical protein